MMLRNYRPDITLFFRPELYPEKYLRFIGGIRVAILSEPLPPIVDGCLRTTEETTLRMAVYKGMAWGAYHWRIFYDPGKEASAKALGFEIDEFRPMPINTRIFYPPKAGNPRPYDVCFVGKATPHRVAKLDFLRGSHLRFIWVAHGVSGVELGWLFRRSKVILNVHADGAPALEPRLYLGAACGCSVVTEALSSKPAAFKKRIIVDERIWSEDTLHEHVAIQEAQPWTDADERDRMALSTRQLIEDVALRFRPLIPFNQGAPI